MSEESEAKRDGARLQRNSGRGKWAKGDATWQGCLLDYKEFSKSFSITRKVWGKVCTDALKVDKDATPMIKLILGDGMSKIRLGIMEWSYVEHLHEENERLRNTLEELGYGL